MISSLQRGHHCKLCNQIFCSNCSNREKFGSNKQKKRICFVCSISLEKQLEALEEVQSSKKSKSKSDSEEHEISRPRNFSLTATVTYNKENDKFSLWTNIIDEEK